MVSERLLLTKLTYNSLVQKLWRQRCPFNMSKRKVRMKWQSPLISQAERGALWELMSISICLVSSYAKIITK